MGMDHKPLVDADLIDDVTRVIVNRFNPERIILFGSRARGDAQWDSDVDLCVVMETDERPPQRSRAIASLFHGRLWPMDIVVYTPREFEEWRHVAGFLIHTIDTEGKVLYDVHRSARGLAV